MKVIPKFQHPADALPKIINRQMDRIIERTHPDGTISYLWKDPETNEEFPLTDLGNGQYSLDRGNGVTSFFNPKQAEQINNEKKKGVDLAPLFANLMTGGYASIAQNASEDIKNGHYLSGGMKMVSPLIVPAFARAPMQMAKGIIGAELASNASDYIWARTMGNGKTFSTDLSDTTGGRISEEEATMLNPATWWGFKLGMNSHHWRPNGYVGVNGNPGKSSMINNKKTPVLSEGMKKSGWELADDGTAINSKVPDTRFIWDGKKWISEKSSKISKEMAKKAKLMKMTPARRVQGIRDKYISKIEENKKATDIDWSDQSSVMASMPDELKLSPVGFDTKTSFLKRYYDNVLKIIGEGGIQNRLLKSGDLRKTPSGQWEGLVDGQYQRVEPTEYIKMRIANEKGASYGLKVSLAPISPGAFRYPMHGTKTKNWKYLTNPSSSPGKNGYWTGIQDASPGSSKLINFYKGKGASVPFFRMPLYEDAIMRPNGMGSSNSYGGWGESLMDMLLKKPGRIQRPTSVTDTNVSGTANEYNFGPNVSNPKSMWNTLDFQEGAGPLAYNRQENENNFA